MTVDDTVRSLRAALEVSPDNLPLRQHLAEVLLKSGRPAEAEAELREALRRAPQAEDVKLMLVRAYREQDKTSAAHVILDDMIAGDVAVARARLERVRTWIREGEVERAVDEYRRALDEDPSVADDELTERLGVRPEQVEAPWREVEEGRMRAAHEAPEVPDGLRPVQSDIDFSQVGGMEDVKADIRRKIVQPLKNPELYRAYGKKVGGGILLYGPPGCGKTYLASATAGEIDAAFLEVGIHEVLDMWVGRSERNLHAIFELAREHKPCVLFFDEADALGSSRGDMRGSAARHTINQFLAELDGLKSDNDGILVLAATNAPWHMDAAFRRPGRFDRVVFVPPPDLTAREAILKIQLRGKPQVDVDYRTIAKKTEGFSGADLKAVVDEAIEAVLERAMESDGEPLPVGTKDLLQACKRRRPTTGEWFRTVRNHVLYANDDGLYDVVKPYLKL